MVHSNKTFRVFVSSTFSDLKEERNALQREVFPKLRELCAQHGCRFQAIDLRWGVSEEAGLDQQTMKICLEEIERSQKVSPKPNFIVLLGDRYGWRPLPYEIPADEFEKILENVSVDEAELLLWSKKQPENEKGWYRKDLNALPPIYCLQSRTGDYVDYTKWDHVEKKIHHILLEASEKADLKEEERMKYYASATEQEIIQGALQIENASDHVFCFFREIDNKNKDKIALDAKTNLIFRDYIDLDESLELNTEIQDLQNQLKRKLGEKLNRNTIDTPNIHKYTAEWTEEGLSTEHVEKMCSDVYNSLSSIILEEIKEIEKIDDLTKDIKDHDKFREERAKFFTGRNEILQEIDKYLRSESSSPLAIYGDSGSGKSALMAKAANIIRKKYSDAEIITRFIGATPNSSNIRSLLESLCMQISRVYGENESTIPTEYQKLLEELPVRLCLATAHKPLIIFLDALDQLSDFENARNLAWLPTNLPNNVHIILSTVAEECLDLLRNKLSTDKIIELKPMQLEEGEKLLNLWLTESSRTLQEHQKNEILNKFSNNGLPLYLKLAFEESKLWKSYTNPQKTVLNNDVPGIIFDLFKRLSSESNHGNILVSHSLSYLATSRHGLSEDEIIDILSRDKDVLDDFIKRSFHAPPEEKLPVVLWSRLYFDLEPYFSEHSTDEGSLLNFYHRQLKEVVQNEYLTPETEKNFHLKLADYFESRKLDKRKVEELPWQLDKSESWQRLKDCLTELEIFMELVTESKKYELMLYWQHMGERFDMVDAYKKAVQNIHEKSAYAAHEYDRVAYFLQLNGYYDDAEPIFRQGLKINEDVLGPEHPETGINLNNLANLLVAKGDFDGAEPLLRRSLEISEKDLGPNFPDIAYPLDNLAGVLRHKGDYDGAEPLLSRSLKIRELFLGPEHPETALTLDNLAGLLHSKGDYDEAETLFKRSLKIFENVLGPEHPDTATNLNNLANLLVDKGDYNGAEILLRRSLKIREKTLGPEHPDTALAINNLAGLLLRERDFDKAEPLFRKSLKIREKVLGPNHYYTAESLNNLASLLYNKGDYDEAEPLYQRSLQIYENILGPEHPDTAINLNNLALVLQSKGDYDGAESLSRQALTINKKVLGLDHPDTALALDNLASVLQSKGNYEEAEPLFINSLKIRKKVLGPNHHYTAESLNNLVLLLQKKGDLEGAELFHRQLLGIYENVSGPEHPNTILCLYKLANLIYNKGDYNSAEPLYRRSLTSFERVLGSDHPNTATVLFNLAHLRYKKGDYDGAETLFRKTLEIREKALGPEHPDTLICLSSLAELLRLKSDLDSAEPLFRKVLEIRERNLGPEHPETATTLNSLAVLLYNKGDFQSAEPLYHRALEIFERTLGTDHPNTIQVRNNLKSLPKVEEK